MKNFKSIDTVLSILVGNLLMAFAVEAFIAPYGVILGGATGIGLVIAHYSTLSLSMIVLIVNVALFILGFLILGKTFALSTLAGTILYPLMLSLFEHLHTGPYTDNTLLAAIYGGIIMGAGVGLVLRVGSSTGGTDIIALILNKYTHLNLSIILGILDVVIIAAQIPFSNSEQLLYGIIIVVLMTLLTDRMMLLGSSKIQIFIISSEYEQIRNWILTEGDAGATLFMIEKGYTRKEEKSIMCIIPRRKLYAVKQKVFEIDPKAFMTIGEVNEVVSNSREII